MKPQLFATLFLLISYSSFGQKEKALIEINPYLQWDNYPSFTFPFNSTRNNTIKINAISWGVAANYKFSLKKNWLAKIGTGYYKYSFNNIKNYDPLFGNNTRRGINYPGGSATFYYVCDKYWYNTITVNLGFEKLFDLKKDVDFIGGFDVINYYTFSQQYNIPGSNFDRKYKTANNRYFGLSLNLNAGLQKRFGNIIIGPTIILPVFRMWKQDMVFPQEENNGSRSKWLRGIGVGFTCSYNLTKHLKL